MHYEDENIWLTQKLMAQLYDITVQNERAVQFRHWANAIVKDHTIQGWVMDEERLKNDGSILTQDHFEKQSEKIREIRISERRSYQKITNIYATALDYDLSAPATKRFFAAVQNKMHFSVHGQTAAEVIYHRADVEKEHMGLTSWDGSPQGNIIKQFSSPTELTAEMLNALIEKSLSTRPPRTQTATGPRKSKSFTALSVRLISIVNYVIPGPHPYQFPPVCFLSLPLVLF